MLALISCVYSYPIKFCSTNCPLWYNKCWQGRDFLQLSMTPLQVTRINHYMNGRVTGHTNISGHKKNTHKSDGKMLANWPVQISNNGCINLFDHSSVIKMTTRKHLRNIGLIIRNTYESWVGFVTSPWQFWVTTN